MQIKESEFQKCLNSIRWGVGGQHLSEMSEIKKMSQMSCGVEGSTLNWDIVPNFCILFLVTPLLISFHLACTGFNVVGGGCKVETVTS